MFTVDAVSIQVDQTSLAELGDNGTFLTQTQNSESSWNCLVFLEIPSYTFVFLHFITPVEFQRPNIVDDFFSLTQHESHQDAEFGASLCSYATFCDSDRQAAFFLPGADGIFKLRLLVEIEQLGLGGSFTPVQERAYGHHAGWISDSSTDLLKMIGMRGDSISSCVDIDMRVSVVGLWKSMQEFGRKLQSEVGCSQKSADLMTTMCDTLTAL